MGKSLARLGIAAGLLVSLTALTPAVAYAAPTGRSVTTHNTEVDGVCSGGDGEYRTVAVCEYVGAGGTHFLRNEFGPWVGIGVVSTARCRPGGGTFNGFLQTR